MYNDAKRKTTDALQWMEDTYNRPIAMAAAWIMISVISVSSLWLMGFIIGAFFWFLKAGAIAALRMLDWIF